MKLYNKVYFGGLLGPLKNFLKNFKKGIDKDGFVGYNKNVNDNRYRLERWCNVQTQ